jgi:hypothetical protein
VRRRGEGLEVIGILPLVAIAHSGRGIYGDRQVLAWRQPFRPEASLGPGHRPQEKNASADTTPRGLLETTGTAAAAGRPRAVT